MRTSKRGYLMAMLAGTVILGAATAGVSAASTPTTGGSSGATTAGGDSPAVPAATTSLSVNSTTPGTADGQSSSDAPSMASTPGAQSSAAPEPTTLASTPLASTAAAAKFKDGQYTAKGTYPSPGGTETLGVTLTLAADVVTESSLELLGGAGISRTYQTLFAQNYLDQVVGKDISTVSLGAIGGSSLTAMGFNAAVAQIEAQAHV